MPMLIGSLFIDGDEYPLPATGFLKDSEALANADVVSIDRFNIPLGPTGPLMPKRWLTTLEMY
jgi:hypothetical protein